MASKAAIAMKKEKEVQTRQEWMLRTEASIAENHRLLIKIDKQTRAKRKPKLKGEVVINAPDLAVPETREEVQ